MDLLTSNIRKHLVVVTPFISCFLLVTRLTTAIRACPDYWAVNSSPSSLTRNRAPCWLYSLCYYHRLCGKVVLHRMSVLCMTGNVFFLLGSDRWRIIDGLTRAKSHLIAAPISKLSGISLLFIYCFTSTCDTFRPFQAHFMVTDKIYIELAKALITE